MAISKLGLGDRKPLTTKQQAFALAVGTGTQSLTDSYREVYQPKNAKPTTVNKMAAELAALPHIAARIRRSREGVIAAVVKRTAYQVADAMEESEAARLLAHAAGQAGAAVSAVALKSKLSGLLIDRQEIRVGSLDDCDLEELVMMRDALRAEVAVAVAADGNAPDECAGHNRPLRRSD